MKALRKLMLGVVAAMGLLLPLTGGSEAKAGGGYAVQVCHYHVYYRSCPHDSWHYLGCYPCAYSAQAAGAALSARGYLLVVPADLLLTMDEALDTPCARMHRAYVCASPR
jgi:hypothetical protein